MAKKNFTVEQRDHTSKLYPDIELSNTIKDVLDVEYPGFCLQAACLYWEDDQLHGAIVLTSVTANVEKIKEIVLKKISETYNYKDFKWDEPFLYAEIENGYNKAFINKGPIDPLELEIFWKQVDNDGFTEPKEKHLSNRIDFRIIP